MVGEPDRVVRGTWGGGKELPTASLERTPLGPTRGNLMGEKWANNVKQKMLGQPKFRII